MPARLGEWPETHAFVVGIVFIAVPCDGGGELHEQFLLGKTAVGHQAQGSCVGEGSEVVSAKLKLPPALSVMVTVAVPAFLLSV